MSTPTHILVVEDEPDLREMLDFALQDNAWSITTCGDGQSAWKSLRESPPNLVLLDWMLPDISGIELLRRMRREESLKQIPVIMLTARGEESDRVHGLDSGADDYVVKPFSTRELRSRIKSRLRSQLQSSTMVIEINNLSLDLDCYRVLANGEEVQLGPIEFRLLKHFMSNCERVYSRNQLMDAVWGINAVVEERTIDVQIRRLRKALEPFDKHSLIQTVRGAGYRFSARA